MFNYQIKYLFIYLKFSAFNVEKNYYTLFKNIWLFTKILVHKKDTYNSTILLIYTNYKC